MSKGYGGIDVSDDETDISDVDPDEMAKMIQDVDDLDSTLFGPTLEKRLGQTKRGPIKSVLHSSSKDSVDKPKAHVSFVDNDVDFDDDLLEDLLSLDGDTSGGKKKNVLSKTLPLQSNKFEKGDSLANVPKTAVKTNSIAELFGVTEGKAAVKESSDWLGLKPVDSPIKTVDSRVSPQKESRILPSEHNKRRTDMNVAKNLSDKSLGETLSRPASSMVSDTQSGVIPEASPRKKETNLFTNTSEFDSRPKDGPRPRENRVHAVSSGVGDRTAVPHESRRQRNASGFVDPLGLFAKPSAEETPAVQALPVEHTATSSEQEFSAPRRSGGGGATPTSKARDAIVTTTVQDNALPAWLGGTGDPPTSPRKPTSKSPDEVAAALALGSGEGSGRTGDRPAPPPWMRGSGDVQVSSTTALDRAETNHVEDNLLKLVVGTSVERQTAASLERQELQLAAALQLKHHEDRLAMMLSRQQMMLKHQEEQLQTLVDRQLERQEMIEQQMREQQNRINVHINTLTSQPGLPTLVPSNTEATNNQHVVSSLESENSQLRSTLETLQGKHSEEIAWVKESYKRQLEMLEASLRDQEGRLKAECVNVTRDYETRLLRLEEEIKSSHRQNGDKLATLQADHAAELQRLRAEQNNTIQDFKKHQDFLLEHMNNSWKAERANMQAGQDPTMLTSILKEVSQCKQAVADLHDRARSLQQSEKSEANLADMHEALSRQRASSEEERSRLQTLVGSLEREMVRQRAQFEEDRQSMRQDIARLERERSSGAEYAERERRELQKLKEDALASTNEERARIEETKLWLATEKSRLATLSRLQDDGKKGVDAERAEAEAALRVAREAARSADEERERLLVERMTVTQEQRRLEHLRLNLGRKAQDLDNLTQVAVATREEALRALESAAQREREQTARAMSIQRQAEALSERERKLSEEKQLMSQERLSLRIGAPQKRNTWVMSDAPEKAVVDPRLVIMKLKANQDNSFGDLDSHYITSYFSVSK